MKLKRDNSNYLAHEIVMTSGTFYSRIKVTNFIKNLNVGRTTCIPRGTYVVFSLFTRILMVPKSIIKQWLQNRVLSFTKERVTTFIFY